MPADLLGDLSISVENILHLLEGNAKAVDLLGLKGNRKKRKALEAISEVPERRHPSFVEASSVHAPI